MTINGISDNENVSLVFMTNVLVLKLVFLSVKYELDKIQYFACDIFCALFF